MPQPDAQEELHEAIRHATAGLKAMEAAQRTLGQTGKVYNTHIYLATVELAHAIEVAMKIALRSQ